MSTFILRSAFVIGNNDILWSYVIGKNDIVIGNNDNLVVLN